MLLAPVPQAHLPSSRTKAFRDKRGGTEMSNDQPRTNLPQFPRLAAVEGRNAKHGKCDCALGHPRLEPKDRWPSGSIDGVDK